MSDHTGPRTQPLFQVRSLRAKLILALGTLLGLGALNMGVYYWGALQRQQTHDELLHAVQRQSILVQVRHALDDQKRFVELTAGAFGVVEPPREEERREFARDLAQVPEALSELERLVPEEERKATMNELVALSLELARNWQLFYDNQGTDPSASVVAIVRSEPLAHALMTERLPAELEREGREVHEASTAFVQTDETTSRAVWLLFLISVIVGGGTAVVAGRDIIQGIAVLRDGVERIGAGNLDHRIVAPHRDELGEVAARINDMAGRLRERTEELEEARVAAEAASRTKSQFLANMSHELRTPLNAIIGYSEMLMEELDEVEGLEDESFNSDLEKIRASGKHLLGLINEILDLSKIESGRMELHLETFTLETLLNEVVATVRPMVTRNENALEVEIHPELGAVHSDQVKLRQILYNLLSNAGKFTEGGRITLSARRLHTASGRDWIMLTVSDTGVGMSAEQLARLFQPFTQADLSTTKRFGGTGLGLTITKRFVEMMGGKVVVESREGEGTAFIVQLPGEVDVNSSREAPAGAVPDLALATETGAPGGPRILVVDDDPASRDMLARTLMREGFRVSTAADGAEGLRIAREVRPALITLDIMMHEMDGWTVLSHLGRDPELSDVPVFVISVVDDRPLGLSLGASEYLTKPVDRDHFVGLVRHHLSPDGSAGKAAGRQEQAP